MNHTPSFKVSRERTLDYANVTKSSQSLTQAPPEIQNSSTAITATYQNTVLTTSLNSGTFANGVWTTHATYSVQNTNAIAINTITNEVYIAGQYVNNLYIFNSDGSYFGELPVIGSVNSFVIKYNAQGIVEWAMQSNGGSAANGVAINQITGEVYISGTFGAAMTIYNSDGSTFGVLANSGIIDAYVLKLNSSGFCQWAARMAGVTSGADGANNIVLDPSSGNVYLTGIFTSPTLVVYNASGTTFTTLTNTSTSEYSFIVSYSPTGTGVWAVKMGFAGTPATGQNTISSKIAINSNTGDIYVVGQATAVITFYNSDGTAFGTTAPAPGPQIGFIVKYSNTGFAQWTAVEAGGSTYCTLNAVAVNPTNGNVAVSGSFFSTAGSQVTNFYNSDTTIYASQTSIDSRTNAFVLVYNSTGFGQWIAYTNGTATGSSPVPFGLAISSATGDIYATGAFSVTGVAINSSNGASFITYPLLGTVNNYFVKYLPSGVVQYASLMNGPGGSVEMQSINVNQLTGEVYLSGWFSNNPVNIYNTNGTLFKSLPNDGVQNLLVVKYSDSSRYTLTAPTNGSNLGALKTVTTTSFGSTITTATTLLAVLNSGAIINNFAAPLSYYTSIYLPPYSTVTLQWLGTYWIVQNSSGVVFS